VYGAAEREHGKGDHGGNREDDQTVLNGRGALVVASD
jgi:hypothetical protein